MVILCDVIRYIRHDMPIYTHHSTRQTWIFRPNLGNPKKENSDLWNLFDQKPPRKTLISRAPIFYPRFVTMSSLVYENHMLVCMIQPFWDPVLEKT